MIMRLISTKSTTHEMFHKDTKYLSVPEDYVSNN